MSERLKTIPDSCFYGCTKLEQVKIPESVENIGHWSFSKCNLIPSIEIPSHVKIIGDGAFADCASLQNFTVSEWNTEFTARDGLLYNCGYKSGYCYTPYDLHLISCPGGKDNVVLDEETVNINEFSFYGCRKFTSLNIPSKVFYINPKAFYSCDSFENFYVSEDNEKYKCVDGMLAESYYLISFPGGRSEAVINPKYIEEGSSYKEDYGTISPYAFYGCNKLKKVTFMYSGLGISIDFPNFVSCDSISEINLYQYINIEPNISEETECFSTNFYETVLLNVYYNEETPWLPSAINESPYWSKFKNINFIEISGIEDIILNEVDDNVEPISVYSINGIKVSDNVNDLKSGMYIVRQGIKTKKFIKF